MASCRLARVAKHAATDQHCHHKVLLLYGRHLVLQQPVVQQGVEVQLLLGLTVGLALGGDGAIGLHRDGAQFFSAFVPGVDGADGVADFLRVDGGDAAHLVQRFAFAGAALVQYLPVQRQLLGPARPSLLLHY